MRTILTLSVVFVALALPQVSHADYRSDAMRAIRIVFGPYSDQALSVAKCESGYRTWASNGQYLGLFQMGSHERATYGHSSTAIGQARAAYRYFVASGKDWSPWDPRCRP